MLTLPKNHKINIDKVDTSKRRNYIKYRHALLKLELLIGKEEHTFFFICDLSITFDRRIVYGTDYK